jgi:homocysteine S-methyltransferase
VTPPVLSAALAAGPVWLDGGLASQLTASGYDLSDELWSARLLQDAPDAIVDAHLAFLRVGAEVTTTASYQATLAGFDRRGYDGPALLRRSVTLARDAVRRFTDDHPADGRPLWIAASVGPYGAMLADGSEYRGNYGLSVAELVAFHRPRLEILADAGPDVLALETVPDLREAEALLIALAGLGVPAWLSYTVQPGQSTWDIETRARQPLSEAFALAAGVAEVIAVGTNCSAPADVSAAVAVAGRASGKPGVAYPNSGEGWDPIGRGWTGSGAAGELPVGRWIADGARLIGGCCRVTPEQLARARASLLPPVAGA